MRGEIATTNATRPYSVPSTRYLIRPCAVQIERLTRPSGAQYASPGTSYEVLATGSGSWITSHQCRCHRRLISLSSTNSPHALHRHDEDLSVAHLAGVRGVKDRFDGDVNV